MASITERKTSDGKVRFLVQVRLKGHPPQTATFDRRSDAKKWAQRTEAAIREGRHFPTNEARRRTLGETIAAYVEEALPQLAESDRRNRLRQLQWWREQLGPYLLADVTPPRVAESLSRLAKGEGPGRQAVSAATRNRYHAALSAVLKWAMAPERGWLEGNPARRVEKLTESKGVVRYLASEERGRLLAAAQESPDPRMYPLVLLALATGAREGELMRLRWSDLDLFNGYALIRETKNGDPKVSAVPGVALDELRRWARNCVRTLGVDYVFALPGCVCGEDGPHFPRKRWENLRDAAGLESFRFHDLRHTTGSYLAMSGASEREIMEVLGHRTPAMARRYSHLSREHVAGVVERMAEKFL